MFILKKKSILLCALALLSVCSYAQASDFFSPDDELTLDDAWLIARENNLALKKERLAFEQAEYANKWKTNRFFPNISLSGSLKNIHALPGGAESAATGTVLSASAGLSLSLNSGIAESLAQDEAAYLAAAANYRKTEASLYRDVWKAWNAVYAAQGDLSLTEHNLVLAQSLAAKARSNYENGQIPELDMLQAEYSAASLLPQVMIRKNALAGSLRNLNSLLGIPLDSVLPMAPVEPCSGQVIKKPDDMDRYIALRHDVVSAGIALARAKSAARNSALTRYGPTVSVSENFGIADLSEGSGLPETGSFSLSLSLPLGGYLPGSKDAVAQRDAETAVKEAELALMQTRVAARKEIESLFESANQLVESLTVHKLNERNTIRAYELARQGYEAGLVGSTNLETARKDRLNAGLALLSAESSYRNVVADLTFALNIPVSELMNQGDDND